MGNSIFISYSRESKEIAERVARILKSGHVDVWMDKELSGGQDWWDAVLRQIRESKALIPIIDINYQHSEACQAEFEYARDLGKHIMPVRVDNTEIEFLPKRVQILHMFDLRQADQDVVLGMVGAVHGISGGQPLPDPLPKPPPVPLSYAAELAERVRAKHDLSRQEQADLLHKLKAASKDARKRDSALKLLRELLRREDTLAFIADEIRELLEHGTDGIADIRSKPKDPISQLAIDRPDARMTPPRPWDAPVGVSNSRPCENEHGTIDGRLKKDSPIIGRAIRAISIGPVLFAFNAWQGSSNFVIRTVIFVLRSILALFYYAFVIALIGSLTSP